MSSLADHVDETAEGISKPARVEQRRLQPLAKYGKGFPAADLSVESDALQLLAVLPKHINISGLDDIVGIDSTAFSISNDTPTHSLDVSTVTLAGLANFVAALVDALQQINGIK